MKISRLLALLLAPFMSATMYVDEPGGGGTPSPAPTPAPAPTTFSAEYVKELREENKTWRQKARDAEQERDTHKTAADKATKDADEKIKGANTAAEQRIVRAELKAAALKAGMVDLDGLKLADLSAVKLNADGEVEGADDLMKTLKESKPYLFGTAQHSSTPGNPPPGKKPEPKLAKDMTDAEYAAARAQLTAT